MTKRIDASDKRLINCSQVDVNQLMPLKYHWAWEHYLNGCANHWMPSEVPMTKDIETWKSDKLTHAEKKVLLRVLGFFSTAESIVGNNIVLGIFRFVTNAEARQYLLRQAFEEALHAHMFLYIVDSLGLDEGEVFNMYHEVPTITEKDSFQLSLTAEMLEPGFTTATTEGAQAFLKNLIGYYIIMEGIFFYTGFAMIFSFHRRNLMTGIGEQYQYLSRDECVSEDTELLTPTGWINVKDITYDTEVAQWHPDGSLTFTKPIRLSKTRVDKAYHLHNISGHVDQLVSENHRVPTITKHGNLKVSPAKDVKFHPYNKVICTGELRQGGRAGLSPLERYLIALQADGTICQPHLRNGKIKGHRIHTFHFSKERKIARLTEILQTLGWAYTCTPRAAEGKRNAQICFRVCVPTTLPTVKKLSSWVDLHNVTSEWCREFIEEAAEWDGHRPTEDRIIYCSVDKDNIDTVQAVATLAGYRTCLGTQVDNRSETFSDYHRLFIMKSRRHIQGGTMKKEEVPYDGFVYGVEVDSTFIVIRRNNAVSVTGNCVHLNFGVDLINGIKAENPELWTPEFQQQMIDRVRQAVEIEVDYAKDCLREGILGLNADLFRDYVQYIADRRLERIGLPIQYGSKNPFPWMSETIDLAKEKNFFETRVTDYQAASSLKWD